MTEERHPEGESDRGGDSARVDAAEVLRRTDERLRRFVEGVNDYALFTLDPRGHVTSWNAGASRINGYVASEIVGKHFSILHTRGDVDAGKCELELEVAGREGHFEDVGLRVRKDGTTFLANVVITAVRDEGGALLGFGKVTRDLSAGADADAAPAQRARAEEHRRGRDAALAAELRVTSQRLHALMTLAVALSHARTRDDVASVVIDEGIGAAGADTCALSVLDEAGTTLHLLAHRGAAPELIERARTLTEADSPETFAALRSQATIWVETLDESKRRFPELIVERPSTPRAHAFWSAPLVVDGRAIGILGMGFYEPRTFPPDERAFIDVLVKQASQGLVRAIRREREEEAHTSLVTTLRSIGDAVIATDSKGAITLMNSVAEGLTGWPEAEARGRPLDEVFRLVSEATREVLESPVFAALRQSPAPGTTVGKLLRTRGGRDIPIDDNAAPIRDERGRTLGAVLVFRDVSRDRQLRQRTAFLEKAGEALMSSLDYRATLARVAELAVPEIADWCAIDLLEAGATAPKRVVVAHVDPDKAALARKVEDTYPPDPNATTGVPAVIRTGKAELYVDIPPALIEASARDAEHLRILRELRLESAIIVPLRGRDRTLGAITLIYGDSGRHYEEADLAFAEEFARRSAMAIENAHAFQQAAAAASARERVLAVVSHDLRNPLSSVLIAAQMIGRIASGNSAAPALTKASASIVRGVRTMTKLVDDLLDLSRVESGRPLALRLEGRDANALVREAVESSETLAKTKRIALRASVSEEVLPLDCDAHRVQQALSNLIGNAVKFTPEDGIVDVAVRRDGDEIVFVVTDTGTGIAAEQVDRLFEAYWQGDPRQREGVGLGLSIVKAIVDAHHGRVWVKTAIGEGTAVSFALPAPSA